MQPALWSIILFFTTLGGAAQGLAVLLALATCWAWPSPGFVLARCCGPLVHAGRRSGASFFCTSGIRCAPGARC
jgi:hypothetical protein